MEELHKSGYVSKHSETIDDFDKISFVWVTLSYTFFYISLQYNLYIFTIFLLMDLPIIQ